MFVFADEAGDFKFSRGMNISRYFLLCTVCIEDCKVGAELLELKRALKKKGHELGDQFHATSDKNNVRTEVYALINNHKLRIDVTLLDKPKAYARVREDEATFYKYAWYYHARHLVPNVLNKHDDVYICAAALETKKGKAAFRAAFNDVFQQLSGPKKWTLDFSQSVADPCLQLADYCAWAIARKWESQKEDFYQHVKKYVSTEFDLWKY